jgi:hypothetical protein
MKTGGGRRSAILAALSAAALMTAALFAPEAGASVPKSPSVDDIVARHVAARGGLKKIRSIQTLREEGHLTAGPNRDAMVMRELKRPSRTRFEITIQGVTGVFLSDGQRGWKMSPFDGDMEPDPLPEAVVREAAEQADIEGPLVDWKTKGHKVDLAGIEKVDGKDAYKLKVTLKSGAVRYEYLDVKTLQRVRTDSTREIRGHAVQIATTYGEYQKTAGVAFPRVIEVEAAGRPQKLRVVVEKIEINPPISDARFEMPATAQP